MRVQVHEGTNSTIVLQHNRGEGKGGDAKLGHNVQVNRSLVRD